ncbi:hypothetical protein J2X54_002620 [Duganella sp. 3397]|uniref:hypothetical protein n=1 Tax=Duganella sp. 3397 TaxID=2817732 RepID=UPI002863E9C0|nr:hypothetical protein [Duganella sp. 3397]MDR7050139.1 hypothetical protein [Duganella sp. 3397]
MEFGIYVHSQGPGGLLEECAKTLDASLNGILNQSGFEEIDAIYVSFQSVSRIQTGFRVCKLRVRRNYDMKLITGGRVHYNCMIECDIDLADCDVIEADSEDKMISYLKGVLIKVAPRLFGEFPSGEAEYFLSAVGQVNV